MDSTAEPATCATLTLPAQEGVTHALAKFISLVSAALETNPNERDHMTTQPSWIARLATAARAMGPYAAVELLLPGGSVIALSLWVYRHRAELATRMRRALARLAAQFQPRTSG